MAIKRAKLSGASNVAAWLNTNATNFFSQVSSSGTNTWAIYDLDGNKVAEFSETGFVAYRANGNYPINLQAGGEFFLTTNIIMCDNGIIMQSSYSYYGSRLAGILITKTNNNKLAFIFSYGDQTSSTENYLYTKLQHVALGDNTTMSTTTTFTPEAGQQTCLVPFATNANIGDTSYTPDAFYILINPNYAMGMGKFIMGADTYISNGYWAIKD